LVLIRLVIGIERLAGLREKHGRHFLGVLSFLLSFLGIFIVALDGITVCIVELGWAWVRAENGIGWDDLGTMV
jgi:hypothetical protein